MRGVNRMLSPTSEGRAGERGFRWMQEKCLGWMGSSPAKWSPPGPWAESQEILRRLCSTLCPLLHQRKSEDPR